MYTTAVTFDFEKKTFSVTCRDLSRNRHWKRTDTNGIYDTTSPSQAIYDIIYEGNRSSAERTKYRAEDLYELAGYTRIKIKS